MKLKLYILTPHCNGCFNNQCAEEETVTLLDEIQVSSSYVALPVGGGSAKITVIAKRKLDS